MLDKLKIIYQFSNMLSFFLPFSSHSQVIYFLFLHQPPHRLHLYFLILYETYQRPLKSMNKYII